MSAQESRSKQKSKQKIEISDNSDSTEYNLYQKQEKIYTRKIRGFYQRLRFITGWPFLIVYLVLPWISWQGRPVVLFDLVKRQFHIFELTFWPQDFILLALLLIIAALTLFFVTTLAGRVYCGYTCPQTIWTSMYMFIEQLFEGSRNQRIKLDHQPWGFEKTLRKVAKHGSWIAIAFFTGFTFISYFIPNQDLITNIIHLELGLWPWFWLIFFTIATYSNAGWLREQICIYMCPYARFQSVMFDSDTLIVSYDKKRGEKRGPRKKTDDYQSQGMGDCIDCKICVQVCPTGIDIREGLQYECIDCAHCIDGCNEVMDKMGYKRGLIKYSTENKLVGRASNIIRPKLLGYAIVLLAAITLFANMLWQRVPLRVDIIRDRNSLYQYAVDGSIENSYLLKIMNMSQDTQKYNISVRPEIFRLISANKQNITLSAGEIKQIPVRLRTEPRHLKVGNKTVVFSVESTDNQNIMRSKESRFISPVY